MFQKIRLSVVEENTWCPPLVSTHMCIHMYSTHVWTHVTTWRHSYSQQTSGIPTWTYWGVISYLITHNTIQEFILILFNWQKTFSLFMPSVGEDVGPQDLWTSLLGREERVAMGNRLAFKYYATLLNFISKKKTFLLHIIKHVCEYPKQG